MSEQSIEQAQQSAGRDQAWAVARVALGLVQVVAATVALVLLAQAGVNWASLGAAGAAGLLVLVSKLLFRGRGA
jgi:hypothetical protein